MAVGRFHRDSRKDSQPLLDRDSLHDSAPTSSSTRILKSWTLSLMPETTLPGAIVSDEVVTEQVLPVPGPPGLHGTGIAG